jgi:hypothetical protein
MSTHERLWMGGIASAGVVLAHWLAYVLATPSALDRHELLQRTGHGAWAYVVALAVGVLVATVAGGLRERLRRGRSYAPTAAVAWARLLAYQSLLFVALEAVERIVSGGTPLTLATEPVILIGLGIQVIVAGIGALALVGLDRAADALVRRLHTRHRVRSRSPRRRLDRRVILFSRPVLASITPRGPPLHLR